MSATRLLLLLPLAIAGSTVAAGGALPAAAHPAAQVEIAVTAGKPSEFRFTLSKTKVEKGTKVTSSRKAMLIQRRRRSTWRT